VAVSIADQENDIWVWDTAGKTPIRQLTSGPMQDFFAEWTNDSRRVIFGRPGGGLFWQAANGSGHEEALSTAAGPAMLPSGVTPDGGRVLFTRGPLDVMAMTLTDRHVEPLVETPSNDRNGVVSPDGNWLAYESNETEKVEIYVLPYPNVKGTRSRVSAAGGTRPLWSRNGRELFFVAPDSAIMAASVDARGSVWRSGAPLRVFDAKYWAGGR
jgi:serine/threonine-protein kinase